MRLLERALRVRRIEHDVRDVLPFVAARTRAHDARRALKQLAAGPQLAIERVGSSAVNQLGAMNGLPSRDMNVLPFQ